MHGVVLVEFEPRAVGELGGLAVDHKDDVGMGEDASLDRLEQPIRDEGPCVWNPAARCLELDGRRVCAWLAQPLLRIDVLGVQIR